MFVQARTVLLVQPVSLTIDKTVRLVLQGSLAQTMVPRIVPNVPQDQPLLLWVQVLNLIACALMAFSVLT